MHSVFFYKNTIFLSHRNVWETGREHLELLLHLISFDFFKIKLHSLYKHNFSSSFSRHCRILEAQGRLCWSWLPSRGKSSRQLAAVQYDDICICITRPNPSSSVFCGLLGVHRWDAVRTCSIKKPEAPRSLGKQRGGAGRTGSLVLDLSQTSVSRLCPFLNLGNNAKSCWFRQNHCMGKARHTTGCKKKAHSWFIALYFSCSIIPSPQKKQCNSTGRLKLGAVGFQLWDSPMQRPMSAVGLWQLGFQWMACWAEKERRLNQRRSCDKQT